MRIAAVAADVAAIYDLFGGTGQIQRRIIVAATHRPDPDVTRPFSTASTLSVTSNLTCPLEGSLPDWLARAKATFDRLIDEEVPR